MYEIGQTLGLVGKGKVANAIFELITDPSTSLDAISRIVFYNHFGQDREAEFKKDVEEREFIDHNSDSDNPNEISLEKILDDNNIKIEFESNFDVFYENSDAIVLAPGKDIKPHDPTKDKPRNFNNDLYDALLADFQVAMPGYQDDQRYPPFFNLSAGLMKTSDTDSQAKLFKQILENPESNFNKAGEKLTSAIAPGAPGKDIENRITYEALKEVMSMTADGRIPFSYRIWTCFPSSLATIIDYGIKLRDTMKQKPKPVMIVTNEPTMASSVISLIAPKLTPYIVGVADFESERIQAMFVEKYGEENAPQQGDLGTIGIHDYESLIDSRPGFFKERGIDSAEAKPFLRQNLYSYVLKEIDEGKNPTLKTGNAVIRMVNALFESKENAARIVGRFYNAMFIGLDPSSALKTRDFQQGHNVKQETKASYQHLEEEVQNAIDLGNLEWKKGSGIFTLFAQGYVGGMPALLEVDKRDQNTGMAYLKSIRNNVLLLARLLQNSVLDSVLREKIPDGGGTQKIRRFSYQHFERDEEGQTTKVLPKVENLEYVVSTGKGIKKVVWDNITQEFRDKEIGISNQVCTAITNFKLGTENYICACYEDKAIIYDSKLNKKGQIRIREQTNGGYLNFAKIIAQEDSPFASNHGLEQILVLNHSKEGLFAISLNDLAQEEEIIIDARNPESPKAIAEGNNVYTVKDNQVYYARLDDNSKPATITIGRISIDHKVEEIDIPMIPARTIGKDTDELWNQKIQLSVEEMPKQNEDRDKYVGEKVKSIEVDSQNGIVYVGTTRRIYAVSLKKEEGEESKVEIIYEIPKTLQKKFVGNLQLYKDPHTGKQNLAFNLKEKIMGSNSHGEIKKIPEVYDGQNFNTTNTNGPETLATTRAPSGFIIENDLLISLSGSWFSTYKLRKNNAPSLEGEVSLRNKGQIGQILCAYRV
ncbi:hypothetical protein HN695_02630 [Candidatus Woesearchaeota archaeon]|nr:hypothetical protein [Candidatus Woesearchaeota archaeon]MBT5271990.1 hypothetical protein [Candidatus Woesearchaeota archaeon]MBT6040890.1 hypothetical protein [Candidatus Woesearchaeota archaeon]MBT6336772.1 hypothetical protein [Candidatus Woesearchaeota archaeon]MBT7927207.1 hypothetical protein [Candidatus Woesearchaeota archaeon]